MFLNVVPFDINKFDFSMSSNVTALKAVNETRAEKKYEHELYDEMMGISELDDCQDNH